MHDFEKIHCTFMITTVTRRKRSRLLLNDSYYSIIAAGCCISDLVIAHVDENNIK
jgi:hypothetical protein